MNNRELQVQCNGCSTCGYPSEMVEIATFSPYLRMFYHQSCFDKKIESGRMLKKVDDREVYSHGKTD